MWLFPFCRIRGNVRIIKYFAQKCNAQDKGVYPPYCKNRESFPKFKEPRQSVKPYQMYFLLKPSVTYHALSRLMKWSFWATADGESQMLFVLYPDFHYWEVYYWRVNYNNHSFEDMHCINTLYIVNHVDLTKNLEIYNSLHLYMKRLKFEVFE